MNPPKAICAALKRSNVALCVKTYVILSNAEQYLPNGYRNTLKTSLSYLRSNLVFKVRNALYNLIVDFKEGRINVYKSN